MHLYMHIVTSNDPIHMSFPNKFPLGNPENEPCKLEIHFDDCDEWGGAESRGNGARPVE